MPTSRTRRISFYSYDSLENPWLSGGGALRDFEVLKRQRDNWGEICVWAGSFPGFQEEVRDGIRFRKLGFGKSYLVSRLTFTLFANLRVLFDRADAIGNSVSAYAPLIGGLLRPGRFYLMAHHYIGKRSREKYSLMGVGAWFCEWLLFRFSRQIIVLNGQVAARVRAMNPRARILESQNGFDMELLRVAPVEADPPFILFLGRYDVYMKGLDLLIGAFEGLGPGIDRDVRLVLAGAASPQAFAAVKNLIPKDLSDSIRLMPNVSEDEKRELLRTCLFFCSPSRFEGFGIAALEANAAGKAVLATDTDGFRASVKNDVSALIVPVGDRLALKKGMEALIGDAGLRRRLGEGGREWAKGFDWDAIAEKEARWIGGGFAA